MHQVHMLYTNVHGGKTPIHMEFFNIIIKGKGHREIALLPAGHLNVIFLCDFYRGAYFAFVLFVPYSGSG